MHWSSAQLLVFVYKGCSCHDGPYLEWPQPLSWVVIEIFTACGQAAVTDFDEDEIKSCVELKNTNFDADFKSDRNFTAKL